MPSLPRRRSPSYRTGHGSPLVLLHPLGADRHVWDPLCPSRQRREVIAIDLPGFGASPATEARRRRHARSPAPWPSTWRPSASNAHTWPGTPWAAGWRWSWGSAASRAASPGSLLPASGPSRSSPRRRSPTGWRGRAARCRLGRPTRPGRSLLLSGAVADPRRVPAAAARRLVRAYALAPDFVRVKDAMRAGRFEGLERIRCPVTLVWPDHDRLIRRPVWVPDRICNVVVSGAGHMPMWDAPEALAQILMDASGGEAGDPGGPRASSRSSRARPPERAAPRPGRICPNRRPVGVVTTHPRAQSCWRSADARGRAACSPPRSSNWPRS